MHADAATRHAPHSGPFLLPCPFVSVTHSSSESESETECLLQSEGVISVLLLKCLVSGQRLRSRVPGLPSRRVASHTRAARHVVDEAGVLQAPRLRLLLLLPPTAHGAHGGARVPQACIEPVKDRIELPVAVIHQPAPVDLEAAEVEAVKREEPRRAERRRSHTLGKGQRKRNSASCRRNSC